MKPSSRRSARSARLAAAISRDDPFDVEVAKGPGFARVIFVFLLLHAIGIGGFAAYKWINPDAAPSTVSAPSDAASAPVPPSTQARPKSGKLDVNELLAPRRTTGTPMVVDHPEMPGYKRYRVGEGERLVEIVRRFHASVAEVEKLNELKPGDPLHTGQWLTIPDNSANAPAPAADGAMPIKAKVVDEPVTPQKPTVIAKVSDSAPKSTPKTPAAVQPVPSREAPALGDQFQARPPKAGAVKTYRVVRGDTAYSIARRHGVDWQELLRINGLTDPRQLRADQLIRIP